MVQRTTVTALLARIGLASGVSVMTLTFAQAQPVRGLYISGAGGASFNQTQTTNPSTKVFPKGRDQFNPGVTGLGSIGWGLDNGFRVELEGNYRQNRYSGFHSPGISSRTSGHQQRYGFMANALFDMDIGQNWIYPYFGAGIGYGRQDMNTKLHYSANGVARTQHINDASGNFAYQGMIGASLPVPWVVGLSTTMEYRFYTILAPHNHHAYSVADNSGGTDKYYGRRNTRTDFNHSLMLGLRYEFDPAPPPPPPIETTTAAPAPSPARSYLVFFDWDSTDLSNRARAIVAVAARNSTSAQLTHIIVNGYTDSSGEQTAKGKAHNQTLSLRRAQVIKSELMRDGVSAGLISVRGLGAANPLVQTALGSKEPQNRRVEIIFR